MTDKEREDLNTFRHDLIKRARWWQWKAETLEKENEQLKAENAALKERLEKAVELPCRIGDTLYGVYNDKVAEYIVIGMKVLADWTLEIYLRTQNKKQNIFSTFSTSISVRYFKDREAAEAKLAELEGEEE